jgi:hypothetical protein
MKRVTLVVLILVLWLASCRTPEPTVAPATSAPESVESSGMPVPGTEPAATEMVVVPQGKIPAASFDAQTYLDEATGFALDYPVGWTVTQSTVGDRGSQTVLLSKPEIADLADIPAGETRVTVAVNQWDPKNDLTAYVDTREAAWDASGFTIVEEEELVLDLGLAAKQFLIQTPDGKQTLFLFAAVDDQYLSLSGEGDLQLVKEIALRLRPISK